MPVIRPKFALLISTIGAAGSAMIQHIHRIQAEQQRLFLADRERLAGIRVEAPQSWPFQVAQPEIAAPPGQWILQQDLAGVRICDRVQRAGGLEALQPCYTAALRIFHLFHSAALKNVPLLAPLCQLTLPLEANGPTTSAVPLAYSMFCAAMLVGAPRVHIHDPTHLPILDTPGQNAGTMSK